MGTLWAGVEQVGNIEFGYDIDALGDAIPKNHVSKSELGRGNFIFQLFQ